MRESRESHPLIAIVDDDRSAREGLQSLIESAGWRAETFPSAQDFLAHPGTEAPSCLILDLQMPGLSGLELQKRMAEVGREIPIVFLTGHGNIPASVKAMKAGAVEFLTKPFDEDELLRAVQEALERDRSHEQYPRAGTGTGDHHAGYRGRPGAGHSGGLGHRAGPGGKGQDL